LTGRRNAQRVAAESNSVNMWALLSATSITVEYRISDVCLEAEASPPGSLEAAKVLSRRRLDVLMLRLGLASVSMLTSKLHIYIYIYIYI